MTWNTKKWKINEIKSFKNKEEEKKGFDFETKLNLKEKEEISLKIMKKSIPFGSIILNLFNSNYSKLDISEANISESLNLDERNYKLMKELGCIGEPKNIISSNN